jgi:small-conductance mechanosensitive channel
VTATHAHGASPLAPLVDEQRLGSAGGQAAVGIAGIVLAIVLVMGQVSLATTKGIAVHLHSSVENIKQGNVVMESVIERAAPSVQLEKMLDQQSKTLANTRDAMAQMNGELDTIMKTKYELIDQVGQMETSSTKLAADVAKVDASTQKMTGMLGQLPGATQRTHKQLSTINNDTAAINTELAAIAAKMLKYGLPRAQGAPTG